MGCVIPADHELQLTLPSGRKIAVAAFDLPAPFGTLLEVGIYEVEADGSATVIYKDPSLEEIENQDLTLVNKMADPAAFVATIKARLNVELATLAQPVLVTPPATPVVTVPTTDAEARSYLVGSILGWKLIITNGTPVLQ